MTEVIRGKLTSEEEPEQSEIWYKSTRAIREHLELATQMISISNHLYSRRNLEGAIKQIGILRKHLEYVQAELNQIEKLNE